MLFEFRQIYAIGNGSTTVCYIVQNPRIENGLAVAEVVGIFDSVSEETAENIYKECQPKRIVIGGNFTMLEYTKELISDSNRAL